MRSILSNVIVALMSATFTFFLFKEDRAELINSNNSATVNLINQTDYPLNKSPRFSSWNPDINFTGPAQKVTRSVVNISAFNAAGIRTSTGSGVIAMSEGFIITNHHVVEDGFDFEITLHNKRKLEAILIGSDPATDLALLKVRAKNLPSISFGNSDLSEVGEWVLAVGNPFNLTSTVTAGIISAKGRNINILPGDYSIESFIQTDAVVNPGNSGGALVNTEGELIGINTAIISESGGYEGYSFAIPSNLVLKVIDDIKSFGNVQRAVLGVGISEVNDEMAVELNLPKVEGVYISRVNQGSSAESAGLLAGDVIVKINDMDVKSVPEMQEQVALYRPGDRIAVEFFRDGDIKKLENVILKSLTETVENDYR